MSAQAIREALNASPLLRGCNLEQAEMLACRIYQKGKLISDRPGGRPAVGVLVKGLVDVYSVSLDGREVKLSVLGKGDCFGICNLFAASDMKTVLKCQTDAEILFIPKDTLVGVMKGRPELAMRYAELCSRKIQFLIQRIELLTIHSCRGKVMEYLLTQADEEGLVQIPVSKEDLAKLLGVSRAALFRELAQLQNQGLIRTGGASITILNRVELERFLYLQ